MTKKLITTIGIIFYSNIAQANSFDIGSVDTNKVGFTLLLILVLAILLETGLTTLFNWRIFIKNFEGKGVKTIVAVVSSFFFVNQFGIDAIAEILSAFKGEQLKHSIGGEILTAFIIAGGSKAVLTLFEKFGIRNPLDRQSRVNKLQSESHLRIKVRRDGTPINNNPISIYIDNIAVGSIDSGETELSNKKGIQVEPGGRTISMSVRKNDGTELHFSKELAIAPGASAILDLVVNQESIN